MKLAYSQLTQHLRNSIAPIYLISGDELLLVQEAVDTIRAAATTAGFTERISVKVDSPNDWAQLIYTDSHNLSLFSNKKIIEVHLSHTKLNSTNGKIFEDYALNPLEHTLFIISAAKLDTKIEKTTWYQAIEKKGVAMPIWPTSAEQLPSWILQRAKKTGLQLTRSAADRLATLVEGNLLAAAQEIEKLYLLYTNNTLDHHAIEDTVTDHARFDIFNLVDSALLGNSQRCLRILKNLALEGIEPTLILWAFTRELRLLADIHNQIKQNITLPVIFNKARIWERRQAGFKAFLQRHSHYDCWQLLLSAAKIDRTIKGVEIGNSWNELESFALSITKKSFT